MIKTSAAAATIAVSFVLGIPAEASGPFSLAVKHPAATPAHNVILARGVGLADGVPRFQRRKATTRPTATPSRPASKTKQKPKKKSGTIFNFNTGG